MAMKSPMKAAKELAKGELKEKDKEPKHKKLAREILKKKK